MRLETAISELDDRFWSKVEKTDYCWEWKRGTNEKGYGKYKLDGRMRLAHRVAYEERFQVRLRPDQLILHECDNPACVNPDHHTVGTVQENNEDKKKKGRQSKGEGIASARFTGVQVAEIRQRAEREGIRAIARDLGVHHSTISRIVNRKNWAHV